MNMEISPFNHILVVLQADEDPSIPLARATRLCRAYSGKMTVFVSLHNYFYPKANLNLADDLNKVVVNHQNSIKNILEKWEASEFVEDIVLSWQQKPSLAVANLLTQTTFNLVLKAPYLQSDFKRLFTSGLDHYFVANCPLPIWMVKPRLWDKQLEVLACVDMKDDDFDNHLLNRRILAVSDKLAQAIGGQMHVIDCYDGEIGTLHIDYNSQRGFKREATLKQKHQEKLELYIKEYSLANEVLHSIEGIPDEVLPEKAARLNAEVAVIGNNEDKHFMDKIFGDTAMTLTEAMPCDILVLKPESDKGEGNLTKV
ncbi:universal stress protein [Aliiglaciecola lipolytica]|uniref:universal stress protein n=1 Tax=Aliiglaciecola lipolytica TaxID=477689 RepID=UPI001C08C8FE|nr:universal stress protein [Aliiglaciecola lipolytica]MBU2879476.1 universal stress protein [Aliiglaciecola lipolytica]